MINKKMMELAGINEDINEAGRLGAEEAVNAVKEMKCPDCGDALNIGMYLKTNRPILWCGSKKCQNDWVKYSLQGMKTA